jgi:L-lactate dehydrogenase complex protein LldE
LFIQPIVFSFKFYYFYKIPPELSRETHPQTGHIRETPKGPVGDLHMAEVEMAGEVRLFLPCILDQCLPRVGEAVAALLTRLGVAWHYPEEQTCCGQFAFTLGNQTTARRLARHFLKVFAGEGPIICPSASCTLTVRRDYVSLAATPAVRQEILAVTSRVFELGEWLAARGPLPWTPRFNGTLVLHRSCKARELGVLPAVETLLAQVAGLTLVSVSPYYTCCGFGGVFSAQHPQLSRKIGAAYLEALQVTGAQGLISLEGGCLLFLKGLAADQGLDFAFYHLAEILMQD